MSCIEPCHRVPQSHSPTQSHHRHRSSQRVIDCPLVRTDPRCSANQRRGICRPPRSVLPESRFLTGQRTAWLSALSLSFCIAKKALWTNGGNREILRLRQTVDRQGLHRTDAAVLR